jgi:hypothetical protein
VARKAEMMSIGPVVNDGSHHPAGFCGSGSAATDDLKSYSNEDFVPDDEDEAGCYCGSDDEDFFFFQKLCRVKNLQRIHTGVLKAIFPIG